MYSLRSKDHGVSKTVFPRQSRVKNEKLIFVVRIQSNV